ncbi:MAG: mismatch-specific DNA-glycosylase [Pseudomonadota bacterium]|nr:mismatch-specific DNA-glycosylase [Pseudomonadota bacterium]
MDHIVPDLLAPHLKLVFCGTAPSAASARARAYYANPGNQFWKVLHRVGLTPTLFRPQEYPKLLSLGIGMTDVCKTASGNDDELPAAAIDPESVRKKLVRYQPQWAAFTSKYSASVYFKRKVEYGVQPDRLGQTQFYVCCSTSGRARRFWREEVWEGLAALISPPSRA